MKHAKKLVSILLAIIMVLSMSTVAFAAQGTNDNSGSITINDAVEGHTYNAYQVLVNRYTYSRCWSIFLQS